MGNLPDIRWGQSGRSSDAASHSRFYGVLVMQNSQISSKSRLPLPRLLAPRKTFTPREVRERLRDANPTDPRTILVQEAASRTSFWAGRPSDKLAFELGRAANRLPTVVYWYRQGVSSCEIGRRLSPLGDEWQAERALDVATMLIARSLNRSDGTDLAA